MIAVHMCALYSLDFVSAITDYMIGQFLLKSKDARNMSRVLRYQKQEQEKAILREQLGNNPNALSEPFDATTTFVGTAANSSKRLMEQSSSSTMDHDIERER